MGIYVSLSLIVCGYLYIGQYPILPVFPQFCPLIVLHALLTPYIPVYPPVHPTTRLSTLCTLSLLFADTVYITLYLPTCRLRASVYNTYQSVYLPPCLSASLCGYVLIGMGSYTKWTPVPTRL